MVIPRGQGEALVVPRFEGEAVSMRISNPAWCRYASSHQAKYIEVLGFDVKHLWVIPDDPKPLASNEGSPRLPASGRDSETTLRESPW